METLSEDAVSTLFIQDKECDESSHDITMDFSFDVSSDVENLTSTPTKSTSVREASDCDSDTSSPLSFRGPNFSPLPTIDSSSYELHNSDQSTTIFPESDSNVPAAPVPEDTIKPSVKEHGVKLVGDNIDKTVQTRYMRVDKQGTSLHYFHAYAAQDRFDLPMPEDVPPIPDNPKLFDDLLPSDCNKTTLKEFFAIHVARILCKHMPCFAEDFVDVIPEHLDHPMSAEMSQKSEVVSYIVMCMSL